MITPTPWKVDEEGVFIMAEVPGYGDAPILEIRGFGRLTSFHGLSNVEAVEEQRRIGTLAAAAPDLLKALEEITTAYRSVCPGEGSEDAFVDIAEKAIAKARGQ